MQLVPFTSVSYSLLIEWIDNAELNYLWGGPVYVFPLSIEQIDAHLSKAGVYPFLFKVDSKEVGFIELVKESEECVRLCRIFIAPAFRGLGYASHLIKLAIEYAKGELKAREITLAVFAHNHSAVKCYQSLGFNTYEVDENSRQFHAQKWSLLKMKLGIITK
ncbi:GNAT family N-acetyltransferase [Endozoicomonas sp. SM1973]|uniref:GNAT family N-acetyltransferase n=1 Tax=Spartinivicinus marinus TaxID=2994442 RepID=A0A853IF27_9GAMM|nr:GNAT family N-acetyltransferase [Spartinivicinus marinus]MCX4029145.1 GNAT family N-acetyltransferase [Spartinivicinus marinus]NYZ67765.1 GNAT family N-acetyltransferase [Spartinivicinus marinus]